MPATQFASTKQGGMCSATAPDVCKTPAPPAPSPVPIPYPNMAQCATATKAATKVKFANMPALILTSEIPMSNGDEAGVAGGVVSGKNMGKAQYKKGSATVMVEGKPVVYHTSMTSHNDMNTMGMQAAPSQTMVMIAM